MKNVLRILSAIVLISAFAVWIFQGANTGWTTTEKQILKTDEITGIEYSEYEKELSLGIELPILATLLSVGLLGTSFIFKPSKSS